MPPRTVVACWNPRCPLTSPLFHGDKSLIVSGGLDLLYLVDSNGVSHGEILASGKVPGSYASGRIGHGCPSTTPALLQPWSLGETQVHFIWHFHPRPTSGPSIGAIGIPPSSRRAPRTAWSTPIYGT